MTLFQTGIFLDSNFKLQWTLKKRKDTDWGSTSCNRFMDVLFGFMECFCFLCGPIFTKLAMTCRHLEFQDLLKVSCNFRLKFSRGNISWSWETAGLSQSGRSLYDTEPAPFTHLSLPGPSRPWSLILNLMPPVFIDKKTDICFVSSSLWSLPVLYVSVPSNRERTKIAQTSNTNLN